MNSVYEYNHSTTAPYNGGFEIVYGGKEISIEGAMDMNDTDAFIERYMGGFSSSDDEEKPEEQKDLLSEDSSFSSSDEDEKEESSDVEMPSVSAFHPKNPPKEGFSKRDSPKESPPKESLVEKEFFGAFESMEDSETEKEKEFFGAFEKDSTIEEAQDEIVSNLPENYDDFVESFLS